MSGKQQAAPNPPRVPATVSVSAAAEALNAGGVAIFPTETVYGIGVKVTPQSSPDRLSQIKQRDPNKPFAWLVSDASALSRYGLRAPQYAVALAERFWPGPLTLIVPASAAVSKRWVGSNRTVALRVPDHPVCLELLRAVDAPVATSSANIQGRIAPRAPWHIARSVAAQVDAIVDGGLSEVGAASTIVDATGAVPRIVRLGPITADQIEKACGIAPEVASAQVPGRHQVAKRPLVVSSTDADGSQRGFMWASPEVLDGAEQPCATIQLVHGMVEFIDRYDAFARFLAARGYAVYGCDLPGHGDTTSPGRWGALPVHAGADLLVNDTLAVYRAGADRFPGAPHFIFAHSMGTFVTRALIGRTSSDGTAPDGRPLDLSGVVLSGTGGQSAMLSKAGNLLARLSARRAGEDSYSATLDGMALGSYNKQFEPARTSCDWLSRTESNVDAYMDDPRNTFSFTVGGYATLTALTGESASMACVRNVPKDLPLLFVAGDKDPVGENGVGVQRAAELYRKAGVADVTVRLFEECRHEILQELNRLEVFRSVHYWLERHRGADPDASAEASAEGELELSGDACNQASRFTDWAPAGDADAEASASPSPSEHASDSPDSKE